MGLFHKYDAVSYAKLNVFTRDVAQLVEWLLWEQLVLGPNPGIPTFAYVSG